MPRIPLVLPAVALCLASAPASSQAPGAVELGGRSLPMLTTMRLSRLNAGFDDLRPGDAGFAHSSSLYVLRHVRPGTLAGVETFVANSYGRKATSIQMQGAGVVFERYRGVRWEAGIGIQLGAIIASAARQDEPSLGNAVHSGLVYKGSGLFAAPYARLTRRRGNWDLGALLKVLGLVPGTESLNRFSATFGGLSIGRRL